MNVEQKLPAKIETLLREISQDHTSGASQLFQRALEIFPILAKELAKFKGDYLQLLQAVAQRLLHVQPSMAPFVHLSRYISHIATANFRMTVIESAFQALPHAATRVLQKHRQAVIDCALDRFSESKRILTHSRSSLVHSFLQSWLTEKPERELWVTEGRPVREGVNLLQSLAKYANKKTLLVDDARAIAVKNVDTILIGADQISEKFVTNKIGTYALVLLAKEFHKPVYVMAEPIKFLPEKIKVASEPVHSAEEIEPHRQNICILNYYFEKVPRKYFDGIITSEGILKPSEIEQIFASDKWDVFKI